MTEQSLEDDCVSVALNTRQVTFLPGNRSH